MGAPPDQDPSNQSGPSFWTTLPGVVTAIAGLVIASTGLIAVLNAAGIIGSNSSSATSTIPVPTTTESETATTTTLTTPLGMRAGDCMSNAKAYVFRASPGHLEDDGQPTIFPEIRWSSTEHNRVVGRMVCDVIFPEAITEADLVMDAVQWLWSPPPTNPDDQERDLLRLVVYASDESISGEKAPGSTVLDQTFLTPPSGSDELGPTVFRLALPATGVEVLRIVVEFRDAWQLRAVKAEIKNLRLVVKK